MLPRDPVTPPGTTSFNYKYLDGGSSGDPRQQLINNDVDPSLLSAPSGGGDNTSVFWGYSKGPSGKQLLHEYDTIQTPTGVRVVNPGTEKGAATMRSISSIMNEIYGSWSREKIAALGAKLAAAGMISPQDANNLGAIGAAYEKFLQLVADRNASGLLITPDDLLKRFTKSGSGAGLPASYTTTTKDVELTNPKTARALMVQTLQQRLGRDPTAAEQQAFLGALHAAEKKDPTIRTSTYKLNPTTGSYDIASQTTQGGVDEQAFASDYGSQHNQKEYGAYQAAGTYFPAMMEALSATVG
jgi:hypothetical protein